MAFTGLECVLSSDAEQSCLVDETAPFAKVDVADEELSAQEAVNESSIRVLGNGCRLCHELYRETLQAASMLGIACEVEHVTDLAVLKDYGLTRNPALVVNGTPLCAALRLHADDLAKLITAFVKHGTTMLNK